MKRWIMVFGLVAWPAMAQPEPTLEQRVNADVASLASSDAHRAAVLDNWAHIIVVLGNKADMLQGQVSVLTKERDDAKAELAKLKPAEVPKP